MRDLSRRLRAESELRIAAEEGREEALTRFSRLQDAQRSSEEQARDSSHAEIAELNQVCVYEIVVHYRHTYM